jgi:hypothetical protein
VIAINDGAEQIRVLHDEAGGKGNVFVLERHLSASDRAVIAEFYDSATLRRVRTHEFGDELSAVVSRELAGERRLAGRLGAGQDDADHAVTTAAIDRFHAM